jgi:hypothetical protein
MDADPFTSSGCTSAELTEWEVHQLLGLGTFSEAARTALAEANKADPARQTFTADQATSDGR